MEALIEMRDVALAFTRDGHRTPVLQSVTLDIRRGEFVALVGPSGVGKSTLLRLLMGLVASDGGGVRVHAQRRPGRLPSALVFQDARLLPWRSVWNNVGFGLEHPGIAKKERARRIEAALALVGLRDLAARYPHELSGGQRQRVALARALAVDPELLLMDEPFGALDAITRESLQVELARIHASTGKTVVFVTHDIDEAVFLADRVIPLLGRPASPAAAVTVAASRPRRRGDRELAVAAAALRDTLASGSDPAWTRETTAIGPTEPLAATALGKGMQRTIAGERESRPRELLRTGGNTR